VRARHGILQRFFKKTRTASSTNGNVLTETKIKTKKMNKKYLIISIVFISFFSCSVLKNKKDIEQKTIHRQEVFRKADTLKYTVPKAVFKDTTIYRTNFEKKGSNTLRIVYDKNGNQSQIDCISDAVRELTETITTLKDTSKTKDTSFNSQNIIYIFLGLAALLIVNKIMNKFVV
jgi:hypothetical protein